MADRPPSVPSLIMLGAKILFAVLLRLITAPFRWQTDSGAPTLPRDLAYAAIRTMLRHITVPQARYIYKGTTEAYHDVCKQTKMSPKSVDVVGTKAHWIGDEDADVAILYLHGGGFIQPCADGAMLYFDRLVKDVNVRLDGKSSVSVLLLAYTLAPEAVFPTQLRQATTILSYLINDQNRDPSDIMLTGDSAGGGLVLSLLSHLLHPRPDVPSLPLSSPLCGTFLYSPWVSFLTTHPSFTQNATKDTLDSSMLRKWASLYLGNIATDAEAPVAHVANTDVYAEALLAESSWWKGLHRITDDVLIWVGGDEVFVDGILEFAGKLRKGWLAGGGEVDSVKLLEGKREAHIGPIMDVMLGSQRKSVSQIGIEEWLMRRLT